MPLENKTPKWKHQLILVEREELTIEGVLSLGSFDEHEVYMETEMGYLQIKGDSLNIKNLNLEQGSIIIEGTVKVLAYEEQTKNKKGLLERLLK